MQTETVLFPSGGAAYRPPPTAPPPPGPGITYLPHGVPGHRAVAGYSTGSGSGWSLRRILLIVAALAIAFVALIVVLGAMAFRYMAPAEPADELTEATRTYIRTLPAAYAEAARDVRAKRIRTKDELVGELAGHAKPLVSAMDDSFKSFLDDQGQIEDAERAGDFLDRVSRGLKGGGR